VLTLESALAHARQKSPRIAAARARAAEAKARLGARPPLRDNPTLEGALGSRSEAPTNDFEVALSQTFELGGRGGARRRIEESALAHASAGADEVERVVLREVRSAFVRGLHAGQAQDLARSVETNAAELQRIAERRHASGDIAALELNVAASGLARARAELKSAEAAQAAAHGELRTLLGMAAEEPLTLAGRLEEGGSFNGDGILAAVDRRPEIRALEAELREAEAETDLGKGQAWPDVTPAVRYERDEGDRVLWAGLTLTLPVFDRGQQLRATAAARVDRLRAELAALTRSLDAQVQSALRVHELRLAAVRELASNAERLADSEALTQRSYEVGQIGLAELLLLRRETIEARRQWLDSLLELAQARAELDSLSGGSR
jgi:cobalt-zinc-cadmium efflux system outer membrane protein